MDKIKIKVPYMPPSVNSYWKSNWKNGTIRTSDKVKAFKHDVAYYILYEYDLKNKPVFETEDLEVKLTLNFKNDTKRDIDNYNKGILDSLTGILWADDKQITLLTIEKNTGTKQDNNFVIEVSERKR